jgi:hypothetical protein
LPQWSLPFVFNYVKNILLEKLSEIFSRHAYVNIIVDLHGHADAVALSDAEATGKHDLVVQMMFLHGFLQKLHNILGALEVARRAYTNLNEQHILYLGQNLLREELLYGLGSNGMEGVIDRYADALLALAHAEGAAQLNLVSKVIFGDQILELLDDLAGALDVAGASDTNSNFQHTILPHNMDFIWGSGGSLLASR